MDGTPLQRKPARIFLLVIVMITVLAVGLWLGLRPSCQGFGCGVSPGLNLAVASFGSNGWVIFNLSNSLNSNLAIISVSVTAYAGSNATNLGPVSLFSNNVVDSQGTLYLPVHFQGVTWKTGTAYNFHLQASDGYIYGVTQCSSGC